MSSASPVRKHPCPDCRFCLFCPDRRCELCRGWLVDGPSGIGERNRMPESALTRARGWRVGGLTAGFRLERATALEEMRLLALEFRHAGSGARLLHLAADDPENLFAAAFRTPPPDDTGLPHILEHSVLCGSRRYPVKDPFVELLKTSLATYLNASTYPDRTVYPCASLNRRDFHNLLRVYCDAVFFPRLAEDHFLQEGRHLAFPPGGRPLIRGVVYNEMRGVYSDPEGILDRHLQRLLFESNAYGRDYGGDPRRIPELSYGQYLDFHRKYYHPSNAWLLTYGDADPAGTLAILDREFLRDFAPLELDTAIRPLERWAAPRQAAFGYPLDAGDSPRGRTDIAVAFAANDRREVLAGLALRVVDCYLLDNAASPLRKALVDSRLGEDLGGSGYADHQRDSFFVVTLKGSEPERAEAAEKLILETIARECEAGFDQGKINSAFRQFELAAREIRPQYPLRLMERVFGAWLYGSDPLEAVRIADRLAELRAALAAEPRYLENQARKWLLDNPHRLRVVLEPDPGHTAKNDRETAELTDGLLAALGPAELAAARETAARLEASQSAGNSPEALATLPRLSRRDVPAEPPRLDFSVGKAAGRDFLDVPLYAGGVAYLDLRLDLSGLEDADLDLLPLFCEALEKTGAAGLDYARMAEREAASLGELEFSAGLSSHVEGPDRAGPRLGVWLKALESDWDAALGVLEDRLFRADFSDLDRLRDIVLQSRVAWRDQIVPSGNAYAALHASRLLNPALALSERLGGCSQARQVDRLAAGLERRPERLAGRLAGLREKILAGAAPAAAQTGSARQLGASRAWLERNASRFGGAGPARLSGPAPDAGRPRLGLAAPADVAFAAQALPAPALTHPDAPALLLLGVQLTFGHLWNEVRVKGGAYGVRAAYDGARGVFSFSSFRDPNIFPTLRAFASCSDFVSDAMDLGPDGLEQAIIGAVKTLDQPLRPPSAVSAALTRHLGGEDEPFRAAFRAGLLGLDAGRVRGAAERLFAGFASAPVCVLASRERLAEENASAGAGRLAVEPLWERS